MRGGADAGRAAVASRYRAAGRELEGVLVEIPERLRTQDQLLGHLLVHLCLLWTGRCCGSFLHDVLLLCVKSTARNVEVNSLSRYFQGDPAAGPARRAWRLSHTRTLISIACRTVQGRFLLRPGPRRGSRLRAADGRGGDLEPQLQAESPGTYSWQQQDARRVLQRASDRRLL